MGMCERKVRKRYAAAKKENVNKKKTSINKCRQTQKHKTKKNGVSDIKLLLSKKQTN